uniref:(E, E)-farnesol/(E)-nerolidol synthase n=1 Tax=Phyllostachys edulis TaxID=38705 RepID=A0A0C5KR55_PHYED|nr:(E, E)-farnesol/(E)-nerolidol synthase [Phyllostachys edulis]
MASGSAAAPKTAPVFHPTVWGDFFINYHPQPLQRPEEWMRERSKQLKEEASGLFDACEDVVEKMNLVDALQRLGIDHHFEDKIITTLSRIQSAELNSPSLHEVALRFRLLRQQGFWVSPDEFNKFRCEDGGFITDITNDPKGLLSLYNAASLVVHNEGSLEEAILFARRHLELMRSSLKSPLAEQVARALQIPLPRTLKRVEALSYIPEYIQEKTYNPSILEFAKLDFNFLQHLHQEELSAITQWWNDLSRDIGLDYVRDRVVECYFWSYTVYYEEEYTRARMILARLFMLASLLDDTYDVHATLEECRKLNEAIQSWDECAVSDLPEYLKKFFLKVISNFREFENQLEPHEKFGNAYNKKAFQMLSGYYLQEAEWFHGNYIPSFKDQVNVSVLSAGAQALSVGLLVGMGDLATKEALEWAIGSTDAVWACGEVARFMDDMSAFKNGRNQKDVASSVECYIKEYSVTSEVALAKLSYLVEDAWKTINQARFEHRALLPVVERVTNLAKSMALLFLDKRDAYTYSKDFKETMDSHFVNPIPL